ncbi:hypothetical protein AB0B01_30925, partial [Streptomyces sp. NPDC044571]
MHMNDDAADRPGESGLSTENLAHPDKEPDTAVYPGEATAGWGTGAGEEAGADADEADARAETDAAETDATEAAEETGGGGTTARDADA